MADEAHTFKRLVVGLEPRASDRAMRVAVDLAELLHLELLGLFIEDPSLRDLAAFPFVREFQPMGGGWRSIDLDRLTDDLDIAIRSAERVFFGAAKDLTTRYQFKVARAGAAEAIASISRLGDIIAITEPSTPAMRATRHFSWFLNAAFHSDAAVMLAPFQVARVKGPVVAIALEPDDPSIRAAAAIAVAAKENLIIVHGPEGKDDDPQYRKLAAETGLSITHAFTGNASLSDLTTYARVLRNVRERLVVAARRTLEPELALALVSSRHVPVLVIVPS
ncbi:MAG TPA: hypothetical protein VNZ94_04035 [Xanthobacteraceae bacterium]|nr:hypothetical protein [Xanthobacteraceae bacterium]